MKILFAHQNFPAQFGQFGAYLARNGWEVAFITASQNARPPPGCRMYVMRPHREPTQGVHRFARPLEMAMINGQAFANAAIKAREAGLKPDVVVAHSGWGSGTFAKAVWPDCKFVTYVEWYYRWPPADAVLEQDTSSAEDGRAKALARNAPTLLDLAEADLAFCPTQFQASQFPDWLGERLTVLHDGVDTDWHCPRPDASLPESIVRLPPGAEIVTYATRGMEPHRGFPQFLRALAILQRRRRNLHAIIGGQDRIAYGPQLSDGRTWKQVMLDELDLDTARLHWPGLLGREDWAALLQATHVHVYLTVPFVLSWSLIEAMASACPLVVSDTEPVREAVMHGTHGLAADMGHPEAIVDAIETLLDDRKKARELGEAARIQALRNYAASWIYPARARLLADLTKY